jgi:hypothetical protein
MATNGRYACSGRRNKGAGFCSNPRTVKAEVLEKFIFRALKETMRLPEVIESYKANFAREALKRWTPELDSQRQVVRNLDLEIERLVAAVRSGYTGANLIKTLNDLERQRDEAQREVERIESLGYKVSDEAIEWATRIYLRDVDQMEREMQEPDGRARRGIAQLLESWRLDDSDGKLVLIIDGEKCPFDTTSMMNGREYRRYWTA